LVRTIVTTVSRARHFVIRQKPNYRVTVTRAAVSSLLAGLTAQYDSIYAVLLGASPLQLGLLNSIKGGVSAAMSPPAGWLVDRYGVKRFYVLGIALMAVAVGIYGIAPDWRVLIPAMILMSFSMRFTGTGCSVLCADQLENRDRATGQNACNATASLALVLSPLIAAALVTKWGGLSPQSLRPLYFIQCAGYGLVLLYVAARLQEPIRKGLAEESGRVGVLGDFRRIFRNAPHLKRWIAVACLSRMPMAMILPFMYLFANKVKGADQYVLSMMSVAMVAAHVLFGIPLGRLADRLGRKKIIYLLTPLWYTSSIITSSMSLELVPLEHMGRWSGLQGIFAGLLTVPAPLIAGLIWRQIGPAYVFIVPVALDLLLRLPLLATIPETLLRKKNI